MNNIKVLIPDMPSVDALLPYLRTMDMSRVYVNNGPLVQELEARLAEMLGAPCVAVSSGTAALELALQVVSHDWPAIADVPAVTFRATGLAAQRAGLFADLTDVDFISWQLDPSSCDSSNIAVPVATFGVPVNVALWESYESPVVIDAAGAFPFQAVSQDKNITTCFSLHATKFIGCGEGGFVTSADADRIQQIRELASFGEYGTNAKMSEYHAAVALASLDMLPDKLARFEVLKEMYLHHADMLGSLPYSLSTTQLNILIPWTAHQVITRMADNGVECRQWYRPYLDECESFHIPPKLAITSMLRNHLIGVPFHMHMTENDVIHVCNSLEEILK